MGWWDDLVKKTTSKATQQSGKLAAKQALRAAQAAVEGLADDFLSAAEGELEEAQAARQGRTNPVAHLTEGADAPEPDEEEVAQPEEAPPEVDREAEALAREERARRELEALKAGMRPREPQAASAPEPVPPEDPHADRPPAVRARLEREERARRELEALKAQLQGTSEDEPVEKTL